MAKILCTIGTRPELIKMAPVIWTLRMVEGLEIYTVNTAQQRDMLDNMLTEFDIKADFDLDVMQPNQRLGATVARIVERFDGVINSIKPDMVLAQGDTNTVAASAMASFYANVPFGHIEAGLRTNNRRSPFPEEINRRIAGVMADIHFAPTESSRQNLLAENVNPNNIFVTGNTVIDTLLWAAARATTPPDECLKHKVVLVTAHRRENFGAPMAEVFRAIHTLHDAHPDMYFVYPVHPNPNVKQMAESMLGHLSRVKLIAPLGYAEMVAYMKHCHFVLTDSGGLQEEAPALGKPVLVTRTETERPEAVEAGVVAMVGPNHNAIVKMAKRLMTDEIRYRQMTKPTSPYGDGFASQRIATIVADYFGLEANFDVDVSRPSIVAAQ